MKLALIVFVMSLSSMVSAKDKLSIGYYDNQDKMNADGTGAYLEAVKYLLGDEFEIEFKHLPIARAKKRFESGALDGFMLEDPRIMSVPDLIHPKVPFVIHPIRVFHKKDKYSQWSDDLLNRSFHKVAPY